MRRITEKISDKYEICNDHAAPRLWFRAFITENNITLNREISIGIV